MTLAYVGCALLVVALFTGWTWPLYAGLAAMLTGLMFSYKPPQDDPVWRKLRRDGVIDEDGK